MRLIAMDFARVHAEMGVLVGKGGFYGNVFRITPPLCFTKEDAGRPLHSIKIKYFDQVHILSLSYTRYQLTGYTNTIIGFVFFFLFGADFFVAVMDSALSKL